MIAQAHKIAFVDNYSHYENSWARGDGEKPQPESGKLIEVVFD